MRKEAVMDDLDLYGDPGLKYLYCSQDVRPQDGCFGFVITIAAVLAALLLSIFFGSCCSSRNAACEHLSDSVRVEVHERKVYVPDTVLVPIPFQTATRQTEDSVSHLENDFAQSDARINPDGTLSHTLETKPRDMPIKTQKQIVYRDSTVYILKTVTKTN